MSQMNPQQALNLIDRVTAEVPLRRGENAAVIQALQVLAIAVKHYETSQKKQNTTDEKD